MLSRLEKKIRSKLYRTTTISPNGHSTKEKLSRCPRKQKRNAFQQTVWKASISPIIQQNWRTEHTKIGVLFMSLCLQSRGPRPVTCNTSPPHHHHHHLHVDRDRDRLPVLSRRDNPRSHLGPMVHVINSTIFVCPDLDMPRQGTTSRRTRTRTPNRPR